MAGCIPWDYPSIANMSTPICTGLGNETGSLDLFEMYMQIDPLLNDCKCEPNCEEVVYHTQVICDFQIITYLASMAKTIYSCTE